MTSDTLAPAVILMAETTTSGSLDRLSRIMVRSGRRGFQVASTRPMSCEA